MNKITIYSTPITPSRNILVDDLGNYLSTLTPLFFKDNFTKVTLNLDKTIKVNMSQDIAEGVITGNPNYLVYSSEQDDGTFKDFYYFILNAEMRANSTILFELSLDTINSFNGLYTFGAKTQIVRQMRDRFVKPTDEGIQVLDMGHSYDRVGRLVLSRDGNSLKIDSEGTTLEEIVDYSVYTGNLSAGTYNVDYTSISDAYIEVYINDREVTKGSTVTLTKDGEIEILFSALDDIDFTGEIITINVTRLSDTNYALRRRIDRQPEGIDVEKYLTENTKLLDSSTLSSNNWYLIYQTSTELSTENLDNPVNCYLLSDKNIKAHLSYAPAIEVDFSEIMVGNYIGGSLETIDFKDTDGEVYVNFGGESKLIKIGVTSLSTGSKFFGTLPTGTGVIATIGMGWSDYVTSKIYLYALNSNGGILWTSTGQKANTSNMSWTFVRSEGYYHTKYLSGAIYIQLITGNNNSVITIKSLEEQPLYQINSKTMKIVQIPYAPDTPLYKTSDETYSFKNWYVSSQGAFKSNKAIPDLLRNGATTFTLPELFVNIPLNKDIARNDAYESKLLSLEFYEIKLIYDSFEKTIPLELITDNFDGFYSQEYNPYYYVDMKVTNTINSTFVFKVRNNNLKIGWQNLFDDMLLVKRNNEMPIYSNTFVDYVRTGYRYDLKTNTLAETQRWVTTGIQIAGAGLSLASSVATGNLVSGASAIALGTSAINSISSNILSKTQADNSLASKLNTLKNQASSVKGSDDIDLFNYYNGGNKLRLVTLEPREEVKKAIADLFYYTGYATNIQGIPNLHSRTYFDYVICLPDFNDDNKYIYNNYMDDIKMRFQIGVTIMHNVNGSWNWDQDKENWEIWLTE